MNRYVTDTMALVLYLEKRKLPPGVKQVFQEAEAGVAEIIIPAMTLAELAYLSEKGRITINLAAVNHLLLSFPFFSVHPLDGAVVTAAFGISDIPELHDRLIAGTARLLALPLLTNDPVLSRSAFVSCSWI